MLLFKMLGNFHCKSWRFLIDSRYIFRLDWPLLPLGPFLLITSGLQMLALAYWRKLPPFHVWMSGAKSVIVGPPQHGWWCWVPQVRVAPEWALPDTHAWGQSGGAGGWCSFAASDVRNNLCLIIEDNCMLWEWKYFCGRILCFSNSVPATILTPDPTLTLLLKATIDTVPERKLIVMSGHVIGH